MGETPGEPKGKVKMFLCPHVPGELRRLGLKDHMRSVNRFYTEIVTPPKIYLKVLTGLKKASEQGVVPEKLKFDENQYNFQLQALKELHDEGKKLEIFIEPSVSAKTHVNIQMNNLHIGEAFRDFVEGKYEDAVESMLAYKDTSVRQDSDRDYHIARYITSVFKEKPDEDLLVVCGGLHDSLIPLLKEEGVPVEIAAQSPIDKPNNRYVRALLSDDKPLEFEARRLISQEFALQPLASALQNRLGEEEHRLCMKIADETVKNMSIAECHELSTYLGERPAELGEKWQSDKAETALIWFKLKKKIPKKYLSQIPE